MICPLATTRLTRHKSRSTWMGLGIILSLSLHIGLYVWYHYNPSLEIKQPTAAPMAIVLNMPFASPVVKKSQINKKSQPKIKQKAGKKKKIITKKQIKTTRAKSDIIIKKRKKRKIIVKKQGNATKTAIQKSRIKAAIKTNKRANELHAPNRGRMNRKAMKTRMNWLQRLFSHIDQFKQYPRKAKRMGIQGMPKVEITMDRQGNVISVKLLSSSKNEALDTEALAMIKRAQPLPRPPKNVKGNILVLKVPILFRL